MGQKCQREIYPTCQNDPRLKYFPLASYIYWMDSSISIIQHLRSDRV